MGGRNWIKWLMLTILAIGLLVVVLNWKSLNPEQVKSWVEQAGIWAPVLFILMFALSALLMIPATVMVLTGSILFGPWWGSFYNLTGATLGAVLAFLVARYIARDWAMKKSGKKMRSIMESASREGWKFILVIRLTGFPYFVLNYMLGVAPVRLWHFIIGTCLGLAPSMTAVTFAGHSGFDALSGGENPVQKIGLAIAAIGVAVLIPILIKIIRNSRNNQPAEITRSID